MTEAIDDTFDITRAPVWAGIDPGKNGSIALIQRTTETVFVNTAKFGSDDVLTALNMVAASGGRAMIESVHSSPQMGVKSAFSFGENFGWWLGALTVMRVPFDRVTPSRWQRAIGCMTKGDKNVTKRRAAEMFTAVKVTHANADALLIAEYCRRLNGGS